MRVVIADTGPIFYLLSIDQIEVLPQLFGRILLPEAVYEELGHPAAPDAIRNWAASLPPWTEVVAVEALADPALDRLGKGGAGGDHVCVVETR